MNLVTGWGVARDVSRGVDLLNRACDDGDLLGCSELGRFYNDGEGGSGGIQRDPTRAREYFRRACDMGFAEACTRADATRGATPATEVAPGRPSGTDQGTGDPARAPTTQPTASAYFCYSVEPPTGTRRRCLDSLQHCEADRARVQVPAVGWSSQCVVVPPEAAALAALGPPRSIEPAIGTFCFRRARGSNVGQQRCFATLPDCWRGLYEDPSSPGDARRCARAPVGFCCSSVPLWRGGDVVGIAGVRCEPSSAETCHASARSERYDEPAQRHVPRPRFRPTAFCTDDASGNVDGDLCTETASACVRFRRGFSRSPDTRPRPCRRYTPEAWEITSRH
nr:sel1 repeat family protein [Deltaproteobacteria bacterium]